MINNEYLNAIRGTKLLIVDIDGVLTDGRVYYDTAGNETKAFNFRDIMGISRLKKAGIPVVLISGEEGAIISHFAGKLQIEKTYQKCKEKDKAVQEVARHYNIPVSEICYIGDDVNDIPAFKIVGCAVGVSNAWEGVLKHVHYLTKAPGGFGAVREICDLILEGKGIT